MAARERDLILRAGRAACGAPEPCPPRRGSPRTSRVDATELPPTIAEHRACSASTRGSDGATDRSAFRVEVPNHRAGRPAVPAGATAQVTSRRIPHCSGVTWPTRSSPTTSSRSQSRRASVQGVKATNVGDERQPGVAAQCCGLDEVGASVPLLQMCEHGDRPPIPPRSSRTGSRFPQHDGSRSRWRKQVLHFDRHVVGDRGHVPPERLDDAPRVRRTVEEIRVAKRDVPGARCTCRGHPPARLPRARPGTARRTPPRSGT